MPRDASGNYTLPLGNPVVAGTIIEDTWANPTMSDIATQLNNVLTRDGVLGPTLPFKVIPGAVGAPGLAFSTAPSSGMYLEADRISYSWLGSRIMGLLADKVIFDKKPQYAASPTANEDLANKGYVDSAVAGGFVAGAVSVSPVDITGNTTLTAANFGVGVIRINFAGAATISVPTVASMALPATPGRLRVIAFLIVATGTVTFKGVNASTIINGIAGPTVVNPISGIPAQWQVVILAQSAVGSDVWSLV